MRTCMRAGCAVGGHVHAYMHETGEGVWWGHVCAYRHQAGCAVWACLCVERECGGFERERRPWGSLTQTPLPHITLHGSTQHLLHAPALAWVLAAPALAWVVKRGGSRPSAALRADLRLRR